MEIKTYLKGLDPYQAKLENAESTRAKGGKSSSRDTGGNTGDRVSVSNEARLRTEAYSTALNTPDIRQEKVDSIKSQVDSGEYRVDSRRVAEKLISEEVELFQ